MEKQKLNVSTIVLIVAIVLIIGVIAGVFIGKNMSQIQIGKKSEEAKIQQENKVIKNETTQTNIQNNKGYASSKQEETKEPDINSNNPIQNTSNKVANLVVPSSVDSKEHRYYSVSVDMPTGGNGIFYIEVKDGVPIVTTNLDKMFFENLGLDISKMKLITTKEKTTKQEIKGFTKKVADVLVILETHQLAATHFIFLMEDGTVEYSSLQNIIDNVSTKGKIEGLENIIRLQKVNVVDSVDRSPSWGDTSAIAIDKENNYYDIVKYIEL